MLRTMDNVAVFFGLLMLFIFIFSILGMHLFGCKFCWLNKFSETECDRANFDSLLWAIVTVFQILTQEDWNLVLYNGMASSGPLASLYFIALMTIGNYVLFNLLVAILVEGFQAEVSLFPTPTPHLPSRYCYSMLLPFLPLLSPFKTANTILVKSTMRMMMILPKV